MKPALSFCGHCSRDVPASELVERPLGKNDGMVKICKSCDEDTPREVGPRFAGYEPTGGLPNVRAMQQKAAKLRKLGKIAPEFPLKAPMADRTPGWVLERVALKDLQNRPRDAAAARATLRWKPWFAELRYLGCHSILNSPTGGWHLFERPPFVVRRHEIAPPRSRR